MRLKIDNQDFTAKNLTELESYLAAYNHHQYAEIWLDYEGKISISLLKNDNWAWLCFFEDNVSRSFHSENPENQKNIETLDFVLSNGQSDLYPLAFCYPTPIAYEALHYFFKHQEKADFIQLIED